MQHANLNISFDNNGKAAILRFYDVFCSYQLISTAKKVMRHFTHLLDVF